MGRKKGDGEIKSHQQHLLMAPSEIAAIDEWSHGHRIRSRGDAIRRLCKVAMEAETPAVFLAAMTTALSREMGKSNDAIRRRTSGLDEEVRTEIEKLLEWNQRSAQQVMSQAGIVLAAYSAYTRQGRTEEVLADSDELMSRLVSASSQDPTSQEYNEAFREAFGITPEDVPIDPPPRPREGDEG